MFSPCGLSVLGLTTVLAVCHLVMSFLTSPPPGVTTVLMLLLANLGVLSLGIGVLGEYIAKIYAESNRRPLFLVDYPLNWRAPEIVESAVPAAPPTTREWL